MQILSAWGEKTGRYKRVKRKKEGNERGRVAMYGLIMKMRNKVPRTPSERQNRDWKCQNPSEKRKEEGKASSCLPTLYCTCRHLQQKYVAKYKWKCPLSWPSRCIFLKNEFFFFCSLLCSSAAHTSMASVPCYCSLCAERHTIYRGQTVPAYSSILQSVTLPA